MTPERITEVRKILSGMNQSSQLFPITVGDLNSLLAALEEAQQQHIAITYKLEDSQLKIDRLRRLNKKFGIAMDGKNASLAEAQQTIALKQSNIEMLVGQVTDETALHAKTAAKLIIAEQTIARQREALKQKYIEPDEDAVTTEEEAYFVNADGDQP